VAVRNPRYQSTKQPSQTKIEKIVWNKMKGAMGDD
jgi:hypothetical protein